MLAWTLFLLGVTVNVLDLALSYWELRQARALAVQQQDARVFAKL